MGQNRHGRDGDDLVIKVPPGTSVMDEDGESLADLVESGSRFMACEGGIGGHGNAFFKTSTHQTPRFAQPGMPGEEKYLTLNLRLIADVGLVGLPNAGKSTLLARLTNARPKIAGYPFTTLIPNLGVVERPGGKTYKIADIPGIIEGAHRGLGLGLSFLQHIERVKCILFLIDVSEDNLHYTLELLRAELGQYNEKLLERPCCVLLTKTDLVLEEEIAEKAAAFGSERVLAVSAHEGTGVERLYEIIDELLETGGAAQTDS
jgi:GTP-binding protein